MTSKRLLVCGGTGFLGKKICETAVAHGWQVTSLSRSGPDVFSHKPAWASEVRFEKFDLASASAAQIGSFVDSADAVVYSLGILLESNYYKTFLSGKGAIDGIGKVVQKWNRNPLKHAVEDGVSYESINRDLAIKLAAEAAKSATTKPFVYISAAGGFPGIPSAYFKTKVQAEQALSQYPTLRAIFLRPGFMFDPSRQMSMYMALGLKTVGSVNNLLGGNVPLISRDVMQPLTTTVVAAAAVQAIADETVSGVVDRQNIVRLAVEATKRA